MQAASRATQAMAAKQQRDSSTGRYLSTGRSEAIATAYARASEAMTKAAVSIKQSADAITKATTAARSASGSKAVAAAKQISADALSQLIASQDEGVDISDALAKGGITATGGIVAQKAISKLAPSLLRTGAAGGAAMSASSLALEGAAPAMATGAQAAAGATSALGTAATAATSAVGTLGAVLGTILVPLAAIAAAAAVVYVAIFKWQDLPGWAKLLLLAVSPLVLVIRALATAAKVASAGISLLTAPFRAASAAAHGLIAGIKALPGLAASAVAALGRLASSAAAAFAAAAKRIVSGTAAAIAAVGSSVSGAISRMSAGMQTAGKWVAIAGGALVAATASILGPAQQAAAAYADYGQMISDVAREQAISTEHASTLALAARLTGRSISDLAQIMPEGSAAAAAFAAAASRLGLSLDAGAAHGAEQLTLATALLKQSASGFWQTLGQAAAPAIRQTTELMASAVQIATRWVAANKPLIATVVSIASKVAIAGSAIATIGGALASAGTLLTPFSAALAAIAAALAIVEYRTGTAASLWTAYGESLRRAYAVVADYGRRIWQFASQVTKGVTDAIRAGNLQLAVTIAWSAAKVAWISALTELDRLTGGVFGGILQSLAAGNWSAAGNAAMLGLQIAWQTGVQKIADLWQIIVDSADIAWTWIASGFDTATGAIEKTWLRVWESMKRAAFAAYKFIYDSVLRPLVDFLRENDPTGFFALQATKGLNALTSGVNKAAKSLRSPEQLAADQAAVDTRTADSQAGRDNDLAARQVARQANADAARIVREQEIARLRAEQARLATQTGPDAARQLAETQAKLNTALADAASQAAQARAADAQLLQAQTAAKQAQLPTAAAAPSGITLGPTFSAAAAMAGAYGLRAGGGGPQEKMVLSIQEMAQTLRELGLLSKSQTETNAEVARKYERFLSAMMFT